MLRALMQTASRAASLSARGAANTRHHHRSAGIGSGAFALAHAPPRIGRSPKPEGATLFARLGPGGNGDRDERPNQKWHTASPRLGLPSPLHARALHIHPTALAALSKKAQHRVPDTAPPPAAHGAEGALNTAIAANVAIFISKLCVFVASGSSSVLAEAVHSVVDIANQLLLRTGLARSMKKADASYNYGYRREVFVWSLISGVGIFCLGAGVSIVHGIHGVLHPSPEIEHLGASLAVLLTSFVIESYSLLVAYRALSEGAALAKMPVAQYVKLGIDPTSVSVVCEDGAAVLGLVVAAACLTLTKVTGNAMYDSAGSIVVGSLLGAVAVFLIQTNRRALIGRSLSTDKMSQIIAMLRSDPVVVEVIDAKSEEIGPGVFRFKAEVEFDGAAVVRRYLDGDQCDDQGVVDPACLARRERLLGMFQAASFVREDTRALEAALKAYGALLPHSPPPLASPGR